MELFTPSPPCYLFFLDTNDTLGQASFSTLKPPKISQLSPKNAVREGGVLRKHPRNVIPGTAKFRGSLTSQYGNSGVIYLWDETLWEHTYTAPQPSQPNKTVD